MLICQGCFSLINVLLAVGRAGIVLCCASKIKLIQDETDSTPVSEDHEDAGLLFTIQSIATVNKKVYRFWYVRNINNNKLYIHSGHHMCNR